jgi:hypothetical protein
MFNRRDEKQVLPTEVLALLREHIESYEQLELLLFLRARPGHWCSTQAVAAQLGWTEALVEESGRVLQRQQLVCSKVGKGDLLLSYAPGGPELEQTISNVAIAYADNRLDVVKVMTANALDRFRTRAVGIFSSAFRLNKRPPQGPTSERSNKR